MPILTGSNSNSKPAGTADAGQGTQAKQYPDGAVASSFARLEPLITPEQLKTRFLLGIPMVLRVKDPTTGQNFRITDEMLQDFIELAVSDAEEESSTIIAPTQFQEKLSYQKQDFEAFGYWQLPRRPISSIEALNVTLADTSDVFVFPLEWIETANLIAGQLNIIPLAFQGTQAGTGIIGGGFDGAGGTAVFFNSLWNRPWVAALFGITYTAGWKDFMLPKMVNNLIGTIAAMRVLSQLAAANAQITSTSLGLDGMSQSVGGPGAQRYIQRMQELQADRKLYINKVKKMVNLKIFSSSV